MINEPIGEWKIAWMMDLASIPPADDETFYEITREKSKKKKPNVFYHFLLDFNAVDCWMLYKENGTFSKEWSLFAYALKNKGS